jgi:hypothetical protein
MINLIEKEDFIEVQSSMPVGQRILFLFISIFPLLAPYQLIIRPKWDSYTNMIFLFCALISTGAVAVSGFFAWAAFAGLNSRLRFDKKYDLITYSCWAPIVPKRLIYSSIKDISKIHIEKHDWSDGSPSYSFVTKTSDGKIFKCGSSWSQGEIEGIISRISCFLGRTADV